jgi:osmotically-inducible protein OsmY
LAAKHMSTLTRIKVDTDENGVVWLSGRAPTQDAVDLATMIAKSTEGVTSVHNDVAIQP